MRRLLAQFTRFGLVGAVGFVVDFGVFNLLRATVLSPENLHEGPVVAKLISTTLAIACNWIGNRHWTFREHRGPQLAREGIQFGLVSVVGMLIGLGCLWVSHYLLGFESVLADNIASNVIGLGLGTAFRFWLYRSWVFSPHRGERGVPVFEEPAESVDEATGSEGDRAANPRPSRSSPTTRPAPPAAGDSAPAGAVRRPD